jgi:hypothetical protein
VASSPIHVSDALLNKEITCRTCSKSFVPSPNAKFLFRDLCIPCQEAFEQNLDMLHGDSSSSHSRQEEKSNDAAVVEKDQVQVFEVSNDPIVETLANKIVSDISFDGQDKQIKDIEMNAVTELSGRVVDSDGIVIMESSSSSSKESPPVSLEVMLGSVLACGAHAGQIFLNNIPYMVEAEKSDIPDGRGAGITMFHNEYSKKCPELYWYRFYGGFSTKKYQCMGLCMTTCGNVFIGVMETMCSNPRYDPVIYLTATKTAKIMKSTQWRRQYVLNLSAVLTTDPDDILW